MGLRKKQAICRGHVPGCMSSHSLSLGSLARLSCGVEHLCACLCVCVCVCVCRTEVSLPLMIQFPRGGRINGWKKLEALDYGGLDIVSQNSCLPRTSEYDLVWK